MKCCDRLFERAATVISATNDSSVEPMTFTLRVIVGIVCVLSTLHAVAAINIAFVGTLSGPDAAAGRDQRDGFLLAVSQAHGRLGGVDVGVSSFDDGARAENVRRIAKQISAAGTQYITGFTNSEAALALREQLRNKRVLMLSSGAGPIALAGEGCSTNFFSTAPADDVVHENAGAIAQRRRYSKAYLIVPPNSQGSVDAAFKRQFSGNVEAGDYAAEMPIAPQIDRIRLGAPGVVYVALRKDDLRHFLNAYNSAGLFHRIPVIVAQIDPELLGTLGRLSTERSCPFAGRRAPKPHGRRRSSRRSEQRYGRLPSFFAMQGYDAALMLGEAFRTAKRSKLTVESVERALTTQRVEGMAGRVRLAANGFPTTDWQAWEIFSDAAGKPYLVARESTLNKHVDSHLERCAAR